MTDSRPRYFATFSDTAEFSKATAFQFSGSAAEVQEDGLIKKGILRTGHWPVTPTAAGKLPKPLTIVMEGKSDYDTGIIALNEVVANFDPDDNIQIPLAQSNEKDHTNKTRNNTGFVRSVWIEERPEWGEGEAELMGALDFTKPDVKENVLNGTFADVSSGVPWIETSDGYSSKLDHVCLTNKPFMKGDKKLTGWMFSDDGDKPVDVAVATLEPVADKKPVEISSEFFYGDRIKQIASTLEGLNLKGYEVIDVSPSRALVKNEVLGKTWLVPYVLMDDAVLIGSTDKWTVKDQEEPEPALDDLPRQEELEKESPEPVALSALEEAQRSRELTLSESNTITGGAMPPTNKLLSAFEGVELTPEQKAVLEAADEERGSLRSKTREADAEKRINELKNLGITMPGALKLYRKVFLHDDGGPAAVLLSDDGKESMEVKASEILDLFVDACKGDDGKVQFSDQAVDTGNHRKPPEDVTAENGSLEERTAQAKGFLKLDGVKK